MAPAPETSPARWDKEADVELVRAITQLVLSNRSSIYHHPSLAQFSGNGGSKINGKLQNMLQKLSAQYPGAEEVVKQELAKVGRGGGKRKAGDEDGSPKKASPKKVKAGKKSEEVEGGTESDE